MAVYYDGSNQVSCFDHSLIPVQCSPDATLICTYYLGDMELVPHVDCNESGGGGVYDEDFVNVSGDSSIPDNQSDGFSTDSGKGSSAVTPADSVHDSETKATPWHNSYPYNSYTSYSKSIGAIMPGHAMIYEFEIPQLIVGRLIGRFGSFVNKIKEITRSNIIIKRHQTSSSLKICAIEGICSEINDALNMIRQRFPVKRFPALSLEQVNNHKALSPPALSYLPSNNKLSLIEGVINDVIMNCIVDLDHIFVQQPTHPTYPSLVRLHQNLGTLYETSAGAPCLPRSCIGAGVICVARVEAEEWYRAEVIAVNEESNQVTARLVDVGGYVQVPYDSLRQIRVDFVTIPFQAIECKLANIALCEGQTEWSNESLNYLKEISTSQVLQAQVIGYSNADNFPYVHLYRLTEDKTSICINEELVKMGFAQWVEIEDCFGVEDVSSLSITNGEEEQVELKEQVPDGIEITAVEVKLDEEKEGEEKEEELMNSEKKEEEKAQEEVQDKADEKEEKGDEEKKDSAELIVGSDGDEKGETIK